MSSMLARQVRPAVARPLYLQVRAMLLERIRANEWRSGESLPNEFVLASHYKVSIGTIRRAVEGLESAGILVRRQGRGTFIARPGQQGPDDRFARLGSLLGAPIRIEYKLLSLTQRAASRDERVRLALADDADVLEIAHSLGAARAVCGLETGIVSTSAVAMPAADSNLDRSPYAIYADAGMVVASVEETITAVAAELQVGRLLGVATGTPLLRMQRLAHAVDGEPVEIRTGYYLTEGLGIGYRSNPASKRNV